MNNSFLQINYEILIYRSRSLILLFTILTLCLSIVVMNTGSAYSQAPDSKQQGKKDLYYGCGGLYEVDCSRILNEFNNFKVNGDVKKVYTVVTNAVKFTTGHAGKVLLLPDYAESAGHVEISNTSIYDKPKFSVSFWVRPLATDRYEGHIISHVNGDYNAGWFFDTIVNRTGAKSTELLRFSVTNSNGSTFSPAALPINPSDFVHVIGTFDGNEVKVFANGSLFGKIEYSGHYDPFVGKPLTIGVDALSGYYFPWSGYVSDLIIFNRPLNEQEVLGLHLGVPPDSAIVGRWLLDSNLKDVSISHNDAFMNIAIASMAFAPDDRLFFTEKNTGKVRIMLNDKVFEKPFVTLPVYVAAQQGLLGIAVDPRFVENHFVYIYYTFFDNKTELPYNRLSRFTDDNNTAEVEKVLLDKIPADPDGQFAGGAIAFGPDDRLYVTVGYGGDLAAAQNKTSLLGKVLRINRDGTIPSDNPFPGSPVYTLGHRNMFGIAFDNKGNGIVTENGEALYDEINLLEPGGNYGFPMLQPMGKAPELANSSSIPPIRSYKSKIAPTQAIYYLGEKFPLLKNKFIYGVYNTPNLYALQQNENRQADKEWIFIFNDTEAIVGPTIAVAMAPNGDLYFGGYRIFKLQSLNSQEPNQISYLIRVELSEGVIIKDLQVYPKDKTMVIKVHNDNASNSFLNLKIPKELIQGIFKVTIPNTNTETTDRQLDYTINVRPRASPTGFTFLNIERLPPSDYRLVINGTHVINRN